MVYPGRPSTGCGVCRQRRVKCDEKRPICENCNKQGLLCSGYRQWGELHIRNQTQSTMSRYTTQHDTVGLVEDTSNSVHFSVPRISLPVNCLALENFFTNFVRPYDPPSVHKGYFQVLPALYSSTPASSALHSATFAFALATIRGDTACPFDILESRAAYALTLSRIQQELHSDQGPASNQTLLAVLLMQVIEALLESGSIEAKPESHLNGAMTLIKIRGLTGSQDETSQILLSSARAQGIMRSFGRSLGLEMLFSGSPKNMRHNPSPLLDTAMSKSPFRVKGLLHQVSQVAELLEEYNRAITSEDGGFSISDTQDLIKRCESCDYHLNEWADSAQTSWQRVSVSEFTSDSTDFEAVLGRTDIYSDVFIARSWNYYRIARIYIQVILMRYSINLDAQEFQRTLVDMVNDICASISFHLGRCSGHEWSATGIGAYFLIWPLLLAQEALPENSLQKTWIINQLLKIGRSLGLGQSRIMCKIEQGSRRHRNS